MGNAPIRSPQTFARGFIQNGAFYVQKTFGMAGSTAGSMLDEMAFGQDPIQLALAPDLKLAQS
jgi:hypothetical protein